MSPGPAVSRRKALAEHLAPLLGRSAAALDIGALQRTMTTSSALLAARAGSTILGQGDPDRLPGPAVPEPRRAGQALGAARGKDEIDVDHAALPV